jgi:hypothetical protein
MEKLVNTLGELEMIGDREVVERAKDVLASFNAIQSADTPISEKLRPIRKARKDMMEAMRTSLAH